MEDRPLDHGPIANAIGSIIIDWGHMESMVKALIYDLALWHSGAFEDEEEFQVLFTALSNTDLRSAIATAKGLAHGVGENFYVRTEKVLNRIDNELRSERNRYVHDVWQPTRSGFKRIRAGVSVRRAPASGERQIALQTVREFNGVEELRDFQMEIYEATNEIDNLIVELNRQIAAG